MKEVKEIDYIIKIFEAGLNGEYQLESFNKDWASISKNDFSNLLYLDLHGAIVHLPTKGLFSSEID